jgi:hypothetical protein
VTFPSTDFLLGDFYKLVHGGIDRALEMDSYCKGYEGAIRLRIDLPGYFGSGDPLYTLELDCYVLGPGRHYEWHGVDAALVFRCATADVRKWIAMLEEDEVSA